MIYLDSAATTLQKPPTVQKAMIWAMKHCSSPGRGGYHAARIAGEVIYRCRETAAQLFEVPSPEQVILTFNATHGLNIAIRTLVHPGSTVLTSGYEHNAVTRVLRGIPDVVVRTAECPLFDQEAACQAFEAKIRQGVDVVICNHVSNVFGFILPIKRISELCRSHGIPLIIDASQSAGILPVSAKELGADFIAMPGHKGLYGPQGTGLLLCGADARPLIYGGTGSTSLSQEMPDFMPDRLEAGTHNVCGAAGLLAGMEFVKSVGIDRISCHECALRDRAISALQADSRITVFTGRSQSGLLSFVARGKDCQVLGEELGTHGVAARAGLHCAPMAHNTAGTLDRGTIRLSFSAFNRPMEIDRATQIIRKLVRNRGEG